jgi:hypothetical protein
MKSLNLQNSDRPKGTYNIDITKILRNKLYYELCVRHLFSVV